jgi:hypothetical protein
MAALLMDPPFPGVGLRVLGKPLDKVDSPVVEVVVETEALDGGLSD